jgi:hypothetical protein
MKVVENCVFQRRSAIKDIVTKSKDEILTVNQKIKLSKLRKSKNDELRN